MGRNVPVGGQAVWLKPDSEKSGFGLRAMPDYGRRRKFSLHGCGGKTKSRCLLKSARAFAGFSYLTICSHFGGAC
jgi:hypothetical protein